ncbi:unnamed protein product [Brassica napus]|uniref:(rape) hypothetical protein n=1 Tax=Brassica napus TaxID=3708 RepID=A0A816XZM9_BRANA|nr:unnamed protein product [Brassica napus]
MDATETVEYWKAEDKLSTLSPRSKQGFKLHPNISLGLNKTVIKKTTTRRRKLKAVTQTIVKMEKKPMARNKALVAEDVAVVAAAALVMEKFCR